MIAHRAGGRAAGRRTGAPPTPRLLTLPSPDPAATRSLAAALATVARPGDVLALVGELGAGKTQFAKGFGAGLGVVETVTSPTFILMAEYRSGRLPLFHLDAYRLGGPEEALAGGLVDDRQAAGVTLIEWAERLDGLLPGARLDVTIEGTGDEPRTIHLATADPGHARYLEAAG